MATIAAGDPAGRADALAESLRVAVLQRKVGIRAAADRTLQATPGAYEGDVARTPRGDVTRLFTDDLQREFESWGEFDEYLNFRADWVGEVTTGKGRRYWYRLPTDKLTVLGESHRSKSGNVQDVIEGLRTVRFMYEPINAMYAVGPDVDYASTTSRLAKFTDEVTSGMDHSSLYSNELESAVLKAMTAMFMFESGDSPGSKGFVEDPDDGDWDDAEVGGYSLGERTAFYFALAIDIASDVARVDWSQLNITDPLVKESAALASAYLSRQKTLDTMRETKDASATMGIRTLTKRLDPKSLLPFVHAFVRWGSRYTVELGIKLGSRKLQKEGAKLKPGRGLTLDDLSPAREAVMWERILIAARNDYLLVGVGDAHRQNLKDRLTEHGIAHAEVAEDLKHQQRAVGRRWREPPPVPPPLPPRLVPDVQPGPRVVNLPDLDSVPDLPDW